MEIADLFWDEVISRRFNNFLLLGSIRGLSVGKSGCGKTTLLLNLLLRPGWLDYDNPCVSEKAFFNLNIEYLKKDLKKIYRKSVLSLFNNMTWQHQGHVRYGSVRRSSLLSTGRVFLFRMPER